MPSRKSARKARRRVVPTLLTGLAAVVATIVGVVVHQSLESSSSSAAAPFSPLTPSSTGASSSDVAPPPDAPPPPERPRERSGPLGEADGAVPDDASVFDDELPAVANLDPDLLDALREAASDAEDDGVRMVVNSGWRSAAYQEHLLQEAVAEHGSEEEAARWVSTPDTSLHVSGDAVDIGPTDAMDWLSRHGADYGLCQIYDNEPWHYELRPDAADDGCPDRYDDPTQDPRMQ
ncbi:M15 family metallopeptidase [Jiangella mangrovi]|uniref:D-alanyl-D-alanine carboxypeptidase-like core domain-containing protein n=1 Tax=Jiangella mangrovi TaxID=1524084 RepID=A0A7W9GU94_9ACTN|nr:M15 family metallopeptidase [Jiangella mangrovi]MBB5790188.1 hypothetical protein [Jiangella mangrovi]